MQPHLCNRCMFAHLGNRTGKLLKGGGVWVHTALLASVELDHTPGDRVWGGVGRSRKDLLSRGLV